MCAYPPVSRTRSGRSTSCGKGDLLVVTELKRFGRNYGEIYKEWFHITKEIGADIKVTSMPILDTTQSKELVGQLITDVVLAVFAYVADEDWTERHELQRQGIEVAKAGGKHLGRPRVEYPENWEDCYERWKSGVISAKEAMTLTGLKKDSFYRLAKKYKEDKPWKRKGLRRKLGMIQMPFLKLMKNL